MVPAGRHGDGREQRVRAPLSALLRAEEIASYRDSRLAAGLGGATVLKELNELSHVIDTARRDWGFTCSITRADSTNFDTRPSRFFEKGLNPMQVAAITGTRRSEC